MTEPSMDREETPKVTTGVCVLDPDFTLMGGNAAGKEYVELFAPYQIGERLARLGPVELDRLMKNRDQEGGPAGGGPVRLVADGPPARVFELELTPVDAGFPDGSRILAIKDTTLDHQRELRAQEQDRLAAMGQLAAGVAHDFNNMLTVTIGYAQVLQMDDSVPETAKPKLETIVTHGHRAEQLIAQILDFSRQRIARRLPTDLVPFLKEAAHLLRGSLPDSVEFDLVYDANQHVVNANLTQIQQVTTNLVLNARDAMPGGGKIEIDLSRLLVESENPLFVRSSSSPHHHELPSGSWSVLSISDTGGGIPPDVLRHVYEPFFTTKPPGSGTGLGLSQVYGIVKQHEGFIEVETEVDRGTTFKIYLPAAGLAPAPVDRRQEGIPRGEGERILVVEDEDSVRTVVKTMLEQLNYKVVTAEDGVDAVRVFGDHQDEIDLVLTDVVMPEMSGLGVAAHVQSVSEIPVLLMSGHMLNEEGEALQRLGTEGHLKKPITIKALSRAVREALGKA